MKLILLILMTGTMLFAIEPSDTLALKDKLKELERKLESIETKAKSEDDRDKAYRLRTEELLGKRKQEVTKMTSEFNKLDNKRSSLKSSIAHQKRKRSEIEKEFELLNSVVLLAAKELKEEVNLGFPSKQEKRLASLNVLIRDIEQSGISVDESFSRFWVILENEERFGSSIEVSTKEMTMVDGVVATVDELRIGRVALMYSSRDNKYSGIIKPLLSEKGLTYEWQTSGLDYKTREAIRNAIAVKTGKRPPNLVDIPVFTSTAQEVK